ncbi:MAG: AarF/UbiB family protein, partial [Candidatus Margulisiibacteriota bacterium]
LISEDKPHISLRLNNILNQLITRFINQDLSKWSDYERIRIEKYINILKTKRFSIVAVDTTIENAMHDLENNNIYFNIGLLRSILRADPGLRNWETVGFIVAHELAHACYDEIDDFKSQERRSSENDHDMEDQCDKDALTFMDVAGLSVHFADFSMFDKEASIDTRDFGLIFTHPNLYKRDFKIKEIRYNGLWRNYREQSNQFFTEEEIAEINCATPMETLFNSIPHNQTNGLISTLAACTETLRHYLHEMYVNKLATPLYTSMAPLKATAMGLIGFNLEVPRTILPCWEQDYQKFICSYSTKLKMEYVFLDSSKAEIPERISKLLRFGIIDGLEDELENTDFNSERYNQYLQYRFMTFIDSRRFPFHIINEDRSMHNKRSIFMSDDIDSIKENDQVTERTIEELNRIVSQGSYSSGTHKILLTAFHRLLDIDNRSNNISLSDIEEFLQVLPSWEQLSFIHINQQTPYRCIVNDLKQIILEVIYNTVPHTDDEVDTYMRCQQLIQLNFGSYFVKNMARNKLVSMRKLESPETMVPAIKELIADNKKTAVKFLLATHSSDDIAIWCEDDMVLDFIVNNDLRKVYSLEISNQRLVAYCCGENIVPVNGKVRVDQQALFEELYKRVNSSTAGHDFLLELVTNKADVILNNINSWTKNECYYKCLGTVANIKLVISFKQNHSIAFNELEQIFKMYPPGNTLSQNLPGKYNTEYQEYIQTLDIDQLSCLLEQITNHLTPEYTIPTTGSEIGIETILRHLNIKYQKSNTRRIIERGQFVLDVFKVKCGIQNYGLVSVNKTNNAGRFEVEAKTNSGSNYTINTFGFSRDITDNMVRQLITDIDHSGEIIDSLQLFKVLITLDIYNQKKSLGADTGRNFLALKALSERMLSDGVFTEQALPEVARWCLPDCTVAFEQGIAEQIPISQTMRCISVRDYLYLLYFTKENGMEYNRLQTQSPAEIVQWFEKYWPEPSPYRDTLLLKLYSDNFENINDPELQFNICNMFYAEAKSYQLRFTYYSQHLKTTEYETWSFKQRLEFLLKVFTEPCEERDQLIEEFLASNEFYYNDYMLTEQYLSRNARDYQRAESIAEGTLETTITNMNSATKADLLLWISGKRTEKPNSVKNAEARIGATLDELKVLFGVKSARKKILKTIFAGNKGLLSKENKTQFNALISECVGDILAPSESDHKNNIRIKAFAKDAVDIIFDTDNHRKSLRVISALYDSLEEKKHKNEDMQPEELLGVIASSYGIAWVKKAQILSSQPEIRKEYPKLFEVLSDLKENAEHISYLDLMMVISKNPKLRGKNILIKERKNSASIKGVFVIEIDGEEYMLKARKLTANKEIDQEEKEYKITMDKFKKPLREHFGITYIPNYSTRIFNAIREEVNFVLEITNMKRLADILKKENTARFRFAVPDVYEEMSDDNIIVEKRAHGLSLENKKREANQKNNKGFIEVNRVMNRQVLHYLFFHADPHDGNIYHDYDHNTNTTTLTFIDSGLVGKVRNRLEKRQLNKIFIALFFNSKKRYIALFNTLLTTKCFNDHYDMINKYCAEMPLLKPKQRALALMNTLDRIPGYEMPDFIFRLIVSVSKLPGILNMSVITILKHTIKNQWLTLKSKLSLPYQEIMNITERSFGF